MIIVTGLPRSGTSLMMQMLDRGGIHVYHEGCKGPSKANRNGFWEDPRVDEFHDFAWMEEGRGAVKVLYPHIYEEIPGDHVAILMERDPREVRLSITTMNAGWHKDLDIALEQEKLRDWVPYNWDTLLVPHHELLYSLDYPTRIISFLDKRLEGMMEVIDYNLYRSRYDDRACVCGG